MKQQDRSLIHNVLFLVLTFGLAWLPGCKDEDEPKQIPALTTSEVTDVTSTTATGGGLITFDGNDNVMEGGLVYSSVNTMPTLEDSKTEITAPTGSFTSLLEGLTSGTIYYVRAYATNHVGTGYGSVVTFTTENAVPVATAVSIVGTARVGESLSIVYTYTDAEDDLESGSTFQWYQASDAAGTGEKAIDGATELTYQPQDEDEFKYIRAGVTPKSATGSPVGLEVKSAYTEAIAEATTVTFTYNGMEVTYGIINSPVTGKRWLDRNLGAPNTPDAWDDWENFGDLFQWGRGDDGHQLINRAATQGETTAVNGTSDTKSTADSPGHGLFILPPASPRDWRDGQNDELWQEATLINNPCPDGWRIPSKEQWLAENMDNNIQNAFMQLKITAGGQRSWSNGAFVNVTSVGYYWSTSVNTEPPTNRRSIGFAFDNGGSGDAIREFQSRGLGFLCRCTED